MPLQVVHAQHRTIQRCTQRTGNASSHQQGACQPGSARKRYQINSRQGLLRLDKNLFCQGQYAADVVPAGQFGHHTAVGLMHGHLAVQGVGQQHRDAGRPAAHQRNARFITRRLNSKDQHERQV